MLTVHLIIVIATVAVVLYSDEQALLWFLGKKQRLEKRSVDRLHMIVTWGLGLIILTGGYLYSRAPLAFLTSSVFLVKMAAVIALILNTYVIGRLSAVATSRSYASLSFKERVPLFISGGISVLGWVTALICGYILG